MKSSQTFICKSVDKGLSNESETCGIEHSSHSLPVGQTVNGQITIARTLREDLWGGNRLLRYAKLPISSLHVNTQTAVVVCSTIDTPAMKFDKPFNVDVDEDGKV